MYIKENLKYTKDHEWIKLDGNIATVGITDFAQSELGDIVYVEVDTLDETLDKDEVFGTGLDINYRTPACTTLNNVVTNTMQTIALMAYFKIVSC